MSTAVLEPCKAGLSSHITLKRHKFLGAVNPNLIVLPVLNIVSEDFALKTELSKSEKVNESKATAKKIMDVKKSRSGPGRKRKNTEKLVANKNVIPEKDVSSDKVEDSPPSQNVFPSTNEAVAHTYEFIKIESLPTQSNQASNERMSNKRKVRPSQILNFKLSSPEKAPVDVGTNAERLKVLAERNENPSPNLYVPTVKFENLALQTAKLKTDLERNIENPVSNHPSTDLLSQSLGHQMIIERKRRVPEGVLPATANVPSAKALIVETSKSMIQETQQMLKYSDKLPPDRLTVTNPKTVFFRTKFAINISCGGCAGTMSLMFVYPLDYARTRRANDAKGGTRGGERQFNKLIDVYVKAFKTNGIQGLYRSFVVSG